MGNPAVARRVPQLAPPIGLLLLAVSWGRSPSPLIAVALALVLLVMVLVSVSHAEWIAHRVGEPLGTLVLAVSVTLVEVALIVTLMVGGGKGAETLARDTVFAALMIVCNGVVGVSLLLNARRVQTVQFNPQGTNALLGTLLTLATLSLVMPTFTSSARGPVFSPSQLAFSAAAAAVMYGLFVFVQTRGLRWMFVSTDPDPEPDRDVAAEHGAVTMQADAAGPLWPRLVLLLLSLVGVIGLAKVLSKSLEHAVASTGAPPSFVGVVIAMVVLLPESVAAFRAASRGEMQTSLNLALGSGLASIGLTIPAIALASIWMDGPIALGLGGKEIVLLVLTAVVSILTFSSGRATVLQATHHLAVFAAFVFLSIEP